MEMKNASGRRDRELAILEHAVENTNEAFVTIDQDHKVLIFNKAAERIFGYSRDEVVGHDLNRIMSPTCSRDHRKAVERYVKTRVPTLVGHASDLMATRRNGEVFPASISFSVTEVEGRLFFTGIVRDMTETRALQAKIVHSERLAALGQLVAEITHEIKNPLMTIGGFARQLMRATEDEKSGNKLAIISSEVQRLENLLKDLREVYLPRTHLSEAVHVKDLLLEIRSMVEEECREKGIALELETDERPLVVAGDEDRLKQVFLNLVRNGMEAMNEGGRLSMQARLNGDAVEVVVSDEGPGISEENKERVFSPFFTTKSHGTGLGLCVSKRIIEEHEGSAMTMESAEGVGTTFTVSLPAHGESVDESTARM